MAFGRDGSELELEVDRLQKNQYKSAIKKIVEIVKESTASITNGTDDPNILHIANDALRQVIEIKDKFFPEAGGLRASEKVEWVGSYVLINVDKANKKITTENSFLPFGAAITLDFSGGERDTAISIFEDIFLYGNKFTYERTDDKGKLYEVIGEFVANNALHVTIELFRDIENVTGFKKGIYQETIVKRQTNVIHL